MRNYSLNIAGYNIRFDAGAGGPELVPSDRFLRNITVENTPDILIRIYSGKYDLPIGAERVFSAPFIEEHNGIRIKNRDEFWNVFKNHNDIYLRTIFPFSKEKKRATMKLSLTSKEWELWIEGKGNAADPMEYPLDGLILYYLTVVFGDIMIHASGIDYDGRGYLFSGVSGKGKTTMAKLWDTLGATVIHDDRLILRKIQTGYRMFNTPVYNNDSPIDAPFDKIFVIEHGSSNNMVPVKGAAAVSLLMANCIQHNWDSVIISRHLDVVANMCTKVPVAMLYFKPDISVIDYILKNGQ